MTKEELAALAHELRTQDAAGTEHPLYCVQERTELGAVDPERWPGDDLIDRWIHDEEDGAHTRADAAEIVSTHLECDPETVDKYALDMEGWTRLWIGLRWEFVTAHFTAKAAHRYIEENRHLKSPRVFVTSQRRCPEWISVVEMLKQAAPQRTDCFGCRYCGSRGLPRCVHPRILETNPDGVTCGVARGTSAEHDSACFGLCRDGVLRAPRI